MKCQAFLHGEIIAKLRKYYVRIKKSSISESFNKFQLNFAQNTWLEFVQMKGKVFQMVDNNKIANTHW